MIIHKYPQWLIWNFRNGRKIPLNEYGQASGSTFENDYMTWERASQLADDMPIQGQAFCFTAADPFVGIDLDRSMQGGHVIEGWAIPIFERFKDTYIEISPSLTGMKFFLPRVDS